MTVDHGRLTPQSVHIMETLQRSEAATRQLLITGALEALRWETANVLNTTQIDQRCGRSCGFRSQGTLIEWFHRHRVSPWGRPDEAATVRHEFDAWLARELSD